MARVSLILPLGSGPGFRSDRIEGICGLVEAAGHLVEVIGVSDSRCPDRPVGWGEAWKSVAAAQPGLASAAVTGLEFARGEVVVILDPGRGYTAADVARAIEPILRRDAELVVASRKVASRTGPEQGRRVGWLARLARRVVGSTDPFSGLVALGRGLVKPSELRPAGSLFTLELLARTGGRRLDVAAEPVPAASGGRPRLGLSDIRCLKRLADDRFGDLSRLVQFCMVGASGMVVDLSFYALFQWLLSGTALASRATPLVGGPLGLAVAGALAIGVALTWNFLLNRRLTFNDARGGSLVRQYLAYALSNTLGIALSFSLRLILPNQFGFFHRHKLAAALVGIIAATGITFSMARWFVFGRRSRPTETARSPLRLGNEPEPHRAGEGHLSTHSMGRSRSTSSCEVSSP